MNDITRKGTRWAQYGDCRFCGARAGAPCLDTRGFTDKQPHRPMSAPHYGKRKLLWRTYRGKKVFT